MEKKTIGQFIAVLRKSNGLTQKDLAEELNVSDKTISHWERDESAPDLSLIPVIADLFGVTADELLRGERRPAVGKAAAESDADRPEDAQGKPDRRTDRQLKVLLDRIRVQFLTCSLIAGGVGLLGLMLALIFNFAVWWAKLGFFIALALYLTGAVIEVVSLVRTRASLDVEEFEGERLEVCRKSVRRIACTTFSILVGLCAFTLPLITINSHYQQIIVNGGRWFPQGLSYVLILAVVWGVVFLIMKWQIVKAAIRNDRFRKLKGLCALFTVLALLITFGIQIALNICVDLGRAFAPRSTFNEVKTFVLFAEQTSRYGSRHDASEQEILNSDGSLLQTFVWKNVELEDWSYEWDESGNITFKIITLDNYWIGDHRADVANYAYCIFYAAEIAAGFIVYFKLKKKHKNA